MSLLSPQLQAFLEVAHRGSVHQAADALHLSQTAVTQRLRQLEHRLNNSLFIRSRRGMQLTTEGEALLRYCLACLELEESTLDQLQHIGTTTTTQIRITGPTSLMSSRIIPQCTAVMEQYTNLLMHFDISDKSDTTEKLREGISQFAILAPEQITAEMQTKQLHPEEYILVCSTKWQGRKLNDIIQNERIIDFDPDDNMTFAYLKHYQLFELAKRQRHFANRTESIANLIIKGLGYSVLDKNFCQPYLKNKKLITLNAGRAFKNDFYLAWYPRPHFPSYINALINQIT